ncbi:MAG: hypothetical protein N3F09_10195, partial [Bacteroidia bacterium]|nr:hypothetical protein [Bacteroidia bacterium]
SFNYSYRKINSSDFLNKELISEGISFYNFLLDIFKIYAFIRVTSDYKTFFKEEFELRGKKNDLITSEDIKNVFIKMGFYKAYGEFKREIKYLFNLIDINLISDEFINVAEILDKNYKKSDFNERNYISHSGLEKNSVLIRKCTD